MTIFMHATLPGISTSQYDTLDTALRDLPGDTFAGCLAHVCVPSGQGIEVFDLWESEEAMDKFGTVMMPVAERLGLAMAPDRPQVTEVYNYWLPGPE
ncbi:hypothetical protein ACFYT4_24125 [Streptomyces sp. NPDC004609]|uniref:hypothetical protein n=1 Tax=Streptomyces sp. NPDC004609 TaxID=3364704 RepID=UPI0036A48D11